MIRTAGASALCCRKACVHSDRLLVVTGGGRRACRRGGCGDRGGGERTPGLEDSSGPPGVAARDSREVAAEAAARGGRPADLSCVSGCHDRGVDLFLEEGEEERRDGAHVSSVCLIFVMYEGDVFATLWIGRAGCRAAAALGCGARRQDTAGKPSPRLRLSLAIDEPLSPRRPPRVKGRQPDEQPPPRLLLSCVLAWRRRSCCALRR